MPNNYKILSVICARGGSQGVKNKNLKNLLGKPLIAYTIEQLIKWGKFDRFIVSTDSEEIAKVARDRGAEVPFLRPLELATDTSGKLEVLRHALVESEKYYAKEFDALLDLDATAPIRSVEDIENLVNMLKEKRADCVFSVVRARRNPYFNMVEEQPDGTVKLCKEPPSLVTRRQDAPCVYEMNASMYIYDRKFLLDKSNKMPYAKRAFAYEMKAVSAIDIDSELDFKFIEFLFKEGVINI